MPGAHDPFADEARFFRSPALPGTELLTARFFRHAYAPHWHEGFVVAIITAVATLFLLRPTLLAKVRKAPGYRSSLDTLVGASGRATAAITAHAGEVKVDGQVWEARSYDPSMEIAEGEAVEVFGLEGITLIVYPKSRPLTS